MCIYTKVRNLLYALGTQMLFYEHNVHPKTPQKHNFKVYDHHNCLYLSFLSFCFTTPDSGFALICSPYRIFAVYLDSMLSL